MKPPFEFRPKPGRSQSLASAAYAVTPAPAKSATPPKSTHGHTPVAPVTARRTNAASAMAGTSAAAKPKVSRKPSSTPKTDHAAIISKKTRPELEKLVAEYLTRQAKARKAKTKAMQRWRAKVKKAVAE